MVNHPNCGRQRSTPKGCFKETFSYVRMPSSFSPIFSRFFAPPKFLMESHLEIRNPEVLTRNVSTFANSSNEWQTSGPPWAWTEENIAGGNSRRRFALVPFVMCFFSFSENWLKLWVFKGVFSRLVISSLKFDSSPWKVTEPQKERIVFQGSFFQGRTVKLRGSIIKKAIRLHIRCQGMPTWATSYMLCMSRQDGRCKVLGAVPKLQQKQWFCKLFSVPRYGIHMIIGIYIYICMIILCI